MSAEYTLPFGKYRGYTLRELPDEYLDWLEHAQRDTLALIEAERERRAAVEAASLSVVDRLIAAGYRALLKEAHPDTGGDPARASRLIREAKEAKELLTEIVAEYEYPEKS